MKIDPRNVKNISDLNLRVAPPFKSLTKMQTKMLAANLSGIPSFARAAPGTGKSTAAIIAALNGSLKGFSNLILVPTPTLADQYALQINKIHPKSAAVLYRTGDIAADEAQHKALAQKSPILVATPSRVLDYLSHNTSLLPLKLQQVFVDEWEMQPKVTSRLIELIESPLTTIISNDPTIEIPEGYTEITTSETSPEAKVRIYRFNGEEIDPKLRFRFSNPSSPAKTVKQAATALKNAWHGSGIVVVPKSLSTQALGEELKTDVPIVKAADLSGLTIDDLENIYVVGWDDDMNIEKLASTMRGCGTVNICLTSDTNCPLEAAYSFLSKQ